MKNLMGKLVGLTCFVGLLAWVFWPERDPLRDGLSAMASRAAGLVRSSTGTITPSRPPTKTSTSSQDPQVPGSAEVDQTQIQIDALKQMLPGLAAERKRVEGQYKAAT